MKARLHIHTAVRNGKTFLKDSFCTHPFKLADITEDRNDPSLQLMLMSSSPGILDNDDYRINIHLEKQCSVQLRTQSYQRLFQMKTGATQSMEVRMQEGSTFIFLPNPAVPHDSSIFSSKNEFYLSPDCLLIWGEVLTCGRKLNGEVFRLSRYHSVTRIFLSEKLILKENLLVAPSIINTNGLGQLEGYTHQATFTCIGKEFTETIIDNIHGLLSLEENVAFGISGLDHGFIVRLMGHKAEQLHSILTLIALHVTNLQNPSIGNRWPATA